MNEVRTEAEIGDPGRVRLAEEIERGLPFARRANPDGDDEWLARWLSGWLGSYVWRTEYEARASAFAQVEEAVKGDAVLRRNALRPYVLAAIADLRTEGGTE